MNSEIILNAPPSVNALYRNVRKKGRVKTARYEKWAWTAHKALNEQCKNLFYESPMSIVIKVGKCRVDRDLDNMAKAPLDTLKNHGIITDDCIKHVRMVAVVADFQNVPKGKISIEITPIMTSEA